MKIEEITCRVCLDILVKPSILRCGHSFCELCAEECINLSDSCPVCRTKTIGICVPNRIVENLIDNWLETPGNENFRENHRIRKENNKETLLLKNKARIILFTVLNENKEERISIGDVQSMYSKLQSSLGRSSLETCPLLFEQIKKEAVLHEGLFIQIDRNQGEELLIMLMPTTPTIPSLQTTFQPATTEGPCNGELCEQGNKFDLLFTVFLPGLCIFALMICCSRIIFAFLRHRLDRRFMERHGMTREEFLGRMERQYAGGGGGETEVNERDWRLAQLMTLGSEMVGEPPSYDDVCKGTPVVGPPTYEQASVHPSPVSVVSVSFPSDPQDSLPPPPSRRHTVTSIQSGLSFRSAPPGYPRTRTSTTTSNITLKSEKSEVVLSIGNLV